MRTPTPAIPAACVRNGAYFLAPFDKLMAPLVASWARDEHELFWLAPKTPPPLTAAKVVAWPGRDGCPLLMYRESDASPLGYLELNPMPGEQSHLWLGHCVLAPSARGTGLGKLMVRMLLDEAFINRKAWRVSLVVFPDNESAVACYRAAGFAHAGEQVKHFATTGRQHRMLQMTIDQIRHSMLTPSD